MARGIGGRCMLHFAGLAFLACRALALPRSSARHDERFYTIPCLWHDTWPLPRQRWHPLSLYCIAMPAPPLSLPALPSSLQQHISALPGGARRVASVGFDAFTVAAWRQAY